MERIRRQGQRLETRGRERVQLARLEAGESAPQREERDAAELADEVLDAVGDLATASGVELERYLPEVDLRFQADGRQMEQAVMNLMDNAIKYTGQGGRVRLGVEKRGDSIIISVRDTGPGIPDEHLPRLFERFYRVDPTRSRERGGTGLGRAIVKHTAQAHGGRVEVASRPGQGSTFSLIIPA